MATVWMNKKIINKNKYGAKRTVIGDMIFDSKGESQRWAFLKLLERQGEISHLTHQVTFSLSYDRKEICKYVADFVYYKGLDYTVEDFKSSATRTPVYRLKKKMMKVMRGIEIKEVDNPRDAV